MIKTVAFKMCSKNLPQILQLSAGLSRWIKNKGMMFWRNLELISVYCSC